MEDFNINFYMHKLILFFLLSISIFFQACGYIMGGATTIEVQTNTPQSAVSIFESHLSFKENELFAKNSKGNDSLIEGNFNKISNDSVIKYKLKNSKNYLFLQHKEGYKNEITPIVQSRYNMGKVVGYVFAATACAAWIAAVPFFEENDNTPGMLLFFPAVGSWGIFPMGPKWIYEKKLSLPPLKKMPQRQNGEKSLLVYQTSVKIDENNVKWNYYESLKHYNKGIKLHGGVSNKKFNYESTTLTHDINSLLKKYKYIDTTGTIIPNQLNSLKTSITITGYTSYTVGDMSYLNIDTKFALHDFTSKAEKLSKNIKASSRWIFNNSPSDDEINSLIVDALDNALIEFLNYPDVIHHFKSNDEDEFNKLYSQWELLDLTSDNRATTVSEVTKATVTIKTSGGHGSGCLISNSGYIITNQHVVSSDSIVEIIYESAEKDTGKVIRYSPLYDLALIQVKSVPNIKPVALTDSKEIELGTEVYAIGTPADIELGQTVTKGIISAKRKVNDKLYIQSDVSVNSGNSGGAMINKDCYLLGIVNAKWIGVGLEGIGFAIPAFYIQDALKIKLK